MSKQQAQMALSDYNENSGWNNTTLSLKEKQENSRSRKHRNKSINRGGGWSWCPWVWSVPWSTHVGAGALRQAERLNCDKVST